MKKRKQKGITLIALIITIIVMLILVAVTVTVALNGGLFEKAQWAGSKTQMETERELLQSAAIGALDNKELKIPNAQTLENNLPEGWTVKGTLQDGYTATSPKGNSFTVENNGSVKDKTKVEIIEGSLYQKVVENPDAYIGAKVIGYTANGWDEWKIYDVSSDGFVRIVPANSSYNFVEEYTYDYEKLQEENLAEIQNICNKFINSNLANLAVLPSFEESIAVYQTFGNYSGLYEYDYANETLGVYWGYGPNSMEEIKSKGWTSFNFDVIPLLKLKSNVMVNDGGSKDAGYEIYI